MISEKKQKVVDAVIEQLKKDFQEQDYTVLEELLGFISTEKLLNSLPEEEWGKFILNKKKSKNHLDKLISKFKKSGEDESFEIQLDNLDWAKLIYNDEGEVVVENEHGTEFSLNELSKEEVKVFLLNI
jgi:hypothetical protein